APQHGNARFAEQVFGLKFVDFHASKPRPVVADCGNRDHWSRLCKSVEPRIIGHNCQIDNWVNALSGHN
ncbi:MAG TPA: hypothetical protein VFV87_01775, partial [Pirellulaceae bacterium]|nr:hypothetical protein [Pirellulaceae bacterium]